MIISAQRPAKRPRRFVFAPTTRIGRWAVGLLIAHVLLMLGWTLMGPLGGFPGLAVGLAAGIVALAAILRRGERAISVFVAAVPALSVVFFVLAEFLVGHD